MQQSPSRLANYTRAASGLLYDAALVVAISPVLHTEQLVFVSSCTETLLHNKLCIR